MLVPKALPLFNFVHLGWKVSTGGDRHRNITFIKNNNLYMVNIKKVLFR